VDIKVPEVVKGNFEEKFAESEKKVKIK